ncbi:hypothetical protein N6H18_03410 [Reichenbachiella agarivorans]|uniref:SpoIIAA-like n=1 Tax=Reichenbachiella agarivorans TaxID=2979464 RepID=A0ABY6CR86_9BACT|nr:hypothetical protein [Reichenbachiella agarivorans]UXP33003.1 hypothetical protein N6H18_03410 [Reichenbachiella agarivorans]
MEYSERVKIIEHRGKEIFYFDFTFLRAEEHPWVMDVALQRALQSKQKEILYISNVSNTHLNTESRKKAKSIFTTLHNQGFKVKGSTMGITGLQKLIVSAIDRDMYFTNDIEKAKDWLVGDDKL